MAHVHLVGSISSSNRQLRHSHAAYRSRVFSRVRPRSQTAPGGCCCGTGSLSQVDMLTKGSGGGGSSLPLFLPRWSRCLRARRSRAALMLLHDVRLLAVVQRRVAGLQAEQRGRDAAHVGDRTAAACSKLGSTRAAGLRPDTVRPIAAEMNRDLRRSGIGYSWITLRVCLSQTSGEVAPYVPRPCDQLIGDQPIGRIREDDVGRMMISDKI